MFITLVTVADSMQYLFNKLWVCESHMFIFIYSIDSDNNSGNTIHRTNSML